MDGGSYSQIASGITALTYTDSTVSPSHTYGYKVTATDAGGTSAPAGPLSVTPPPAVPSGLTATAGNAQVTLAWTASTGATSYKVYQLISGTYTYIATVSGATTDTVTSLTNGTSYSFEVTAVNGWRRKRQVLTPPARHRNLQFLPRPPA